MHTSRQVIPGLGIEFSKPQLLGPIRDIRILAVREERFSVDEADLRKLNYSFQIAEYETYINR